MVEYKDQYATPVRAKKLQLAIKNHRQENTGTHQKKIPHV